MAAAASSSSGWNHDVFLSFRGPDTRNTFTGHLSHALKAKGINTFIDDELERGQDISDSLVKVIEGSRISIVIFSTDYAGSSSCLEELVKILDCRKLRGQLVLPVFYNVNPSDVEKQSGTYADSLAKLEAQLEVNLEKMEEWRLALSQTSTLSGWHLDKGNEAELIQTIVEKVSMELNRVSLHIADHPVGIESHILDMVNLLSFTTKEAQFVGIHGLGGIGKTTIAKVVFNKNANQFEGRCFLANVKDTLNEKGFVELQETLLMKIFGIKKIKLGNIHEGIEVIQRRLYDKRVLIVIDDVDKRDQLKNLAGARSWFSPGSRIIITTRDEQLLKVHEVKEIYHVKELCHEYALELFSWNAFKKPQPDEDYLELSHSITKYAQGLPLALVILGSFLYGRSKPEWKSELLNLNNNPNKEINDILKISFDKLESYQKNIFLHIACFFKGKDKDYVMKILDACDLNPIIGVKVLEEKSLIKIKDNNIEMHDLVEAMGRQVVNDESPNISERSRLWNPDDVLRVLTEDMGPFETEALVCDLYHLEEVNVEVFAKMKRLKILVLYGVRISRSVESLSNDLRWIQWLGCPLESLPSKFRARKLVALKMSGSCIRELGACFKSFVNLKDLDLSYCSFLTKTPDFSTTTNLESLNLNYCKNLVEVHESVGYLNKLKFLKLMSCCSLEFLPSRFKLGSLSLLHLRGCEKLKMFPEIVEKMPCLEIIDLCEIAIRFLPSSISNISGLKILNLSCCKKFEMFPEIVVEMTCLERIDLSETAIKFLPSSICNIRGLKNLNLSYCEKFETFPEIMIEMTCLERIDLSGTAIKFLPSSICNIRGLKDLNLSYCNKIEIFPEIMVEMTCLERINLSGTAIRFLPSSICNIRGLKDLALSFCEKFEMFPKMMVEMKCLERIDLSGTAIRFVPSSISNISGLKILNLLLCEKIEIFPEIIVEMTCLERIDLSGTAIRFLPSRILYLKHLKSLYLVRCVKLKEIPELSLNIEEVRAKDCYSLERYSQLLRIFALNWKAEPIFEFINCHKLAESLDTISSDWLQNHEFRAKSPIEVEFPGNKIPKWFNYISENKTSFSFKLTSQAFEKLEALVLSATMDSPINSPKEVEIYVIGQTVRFPSKMHVLWDIGPDHVWLYYLPSCSFRKHITTIKNDNVQFEVSIKHHEYGQPFKSCGVHFVYWQGLNPDDAIGWSSTVHRQIENVDRTVGKVTEDSLVVVNNTAAHQNDLMIDENQLNQRFSREIQRLRCDKSNEDANPTAKRRKIAEDSGSD